MKITIKDINVQNKTVIVRCDFNVSIKDNKIIDDTRIKESLKTIKYLEEQNSKIILISHLGKVKTTADKKTYSLEIVKNQLNKYLDNKVELETSLDFNQIKKRIKSLPQGKILLLENTRFYDLDNQKESNCDENLSQNYASLADVFINDAFATIHRRHASNYGISKYLPSAIGFLIEKELQNLDILNNPKRPYAIIMGGSKISDKLNLINSLIEKVDYLLIGGAMSNTFLKASKIEIGNSLYEESMLDYCQKLMTKYQNKIILPIDFKGLTNNKVKTKNIKTIDKDFTIFDIGPKTIKKYEQVLKNVNTIFWNGPLGKYEEQIYQKGTKQILKYITKYPKTTILGGGDIVSACNILGYQNKVSFSSTGGGATLSYLENPNQPGLTNIENKEI